MGKIQTMRPQDIVILLKKLSPAGYSLNGRQLSESLGISASEISEAMDRNAVAGLIDSTKSQINTLALKDFLVYGLKYCFPAVIGGIVRGVPTAVSAAPFSDSIVSGSETYVWPSPAGEGRGQAVEPLYHSVPEAVLKDTDFYRLMAIADVLRIGRAREKERAIDELKVYIARYERQQGKN